MFFFNSGALYSVNTSTAVATLVVQMTYGNVTGVFGENGMINFTTPNGGLYNLNLTSLVATLVGASGPDFSNLTAAPLFDSLSLSVTGGGTVLTHGTNATFAIAIDNAGPQTEVGPTTVTTTLQTGMTFVSAAGTGWTSSVSGSTVTLTYTGQIQAGAATPQATMIVAVGSAAVGTRTTVFTVDGQLFDITQSIGNTTAVNTVV